MSLPLLIASRNEMKVAELSWLAEKLGLNWTSLQSLGLAIDPPSETGTSLSENVSIKAQYYSLRARMPALSDDSGLEVAALGGAPGSHTARCGSDLTDAARNLRLLKEMSSVPIEQRGAVFRCALAFASGGNLVATAAGCLSGVVTLEPRGIGPGYGPIFLIPSLGKTIAELSVEEKAELSHRGHAFTRLAPALTTFLA